MAITTIPDGTRRPGGTVGEKEHIIAVELTLLGGICSGAMRQLDGTRGKSGIAGEGRRGSERHDHHGDEDGHSQDVGAIVRVTAGMCVVIST